MLQVQMYFICLMKLKAMGNDDLFYNSFLFILLINHRGDYLFCSIHITIQSVNSLSIPIRMNQSLMTVVFFDLVMLQIITPNCGLHEFV